MSSSRTEDSVGAYNDKTFTFLVTGKEVVVYSSSFLLRTAFFFTQKQLRVEMASKISYIL